VSRALWGAALLLYGGLIFWLSSCPLPEGPPLFPFQYGDKLLHFLEYLLFGFLAWKTFLPQQKKGIAFVLLVSIAYAGSDELHQLFVPTRAASFLDWGTDSLGIMGGLLFGYRLDGGYLHF
jgi:VanZ family protein